ncbi:angiotensin-converting enzyme 2-like [Glandiceps talaboti]
MSSWKTNRDSLLFVVLVGMCCTLCTADDPTPTYPETQAQAFLDKYTARAQEVRSRSSLASWDYSTNLTDHNLKLKQEAGAESAAFSQEAYTNATAFKDDKLFYSESVVRQLEFLTVIGDSILESTDYDTIKDVLSTMSLTYALGEVCLPWDDNKCYLQDPELTGIMAESVNYTERLWVWQHWRDETGKQMRDQYVDYVTYKNKAAELNGYDDYGAYWRGNYENDMADGEDIEADAWQMYMDILPLYEKLHTYVRYKLKDIYGDKINRDGGCLPANVLGDMWGRFWTNLYVHMVPYPDAADVDVTDELMAQNYTAVKMTELADDFFVSMGLPEVPQSFWDHSMLTRPDDGRQVECHATAWDFTNGEDFRVRMCAEVNMDDLMVLHHELGHIQYYLQYTNLPVPFRGGANEGFHEAVGELIALSAATPQHLYDVNLLDELPNDYESDINFLMKQALTMVATLPFSIGLEKWRWEVFRGNITNDKWTEAFWELKHTILGVVEPTPRTEEDLDPTALFHVANDYSFLRYYTRTFIQFQFYEALCAAKGWEGDLYKCDFYNSTEAGIKLSDMLQLGRSKPWPEAMLNIAGTDKIDSGPLLEYFKPLNEWLNKFIIDNNLLGELGWDRDCKWRPYTEDVTPTDPTQFWNSVFFPHLHQCLKPQPTKGPVDAGLNTVSSKLLTMIGLLFAVLVL